MSDDYSICTRMYAVHSDKFNGRDMKAKGSKKGSMHGKVKVYSEEELQAFAEERGIEVSEKNFK